MPGRFAVCPPSICQDFIRDLCCGAANRDAIACGLDTPARSNIVGAAAPRWCRHIPGTQQHAMLRPCVVRSPISQSRGVLCDRTYPLHASCAPGAWLHCKHLSTLVAPWLLLIASNSSTWCSSGCNIGLLLGPSS